VVGRCPPRGTLVNACSARRPVDGRRPCCSRARAQSPITTRCRRCGRKGHTAFYLRRVWQGTRPARSAQKHYSRAISQASVPWRDWRTLRKLLRTQLALWGCARGSWSSFAKVPDLGAGRARCGRRARAPGARGQCCVPHPQRQPPMTHDTRATRPRPPPLHRRLLVRPRRPQRRRPSGPAPPPPVGAHRPSLAAALHRSVPPRLRRRPHPGVLRQPQPGPAVGARVVARAHRGGQPRPHRGPRAVPRAALPPAVPAGAGL
jgi:hypothetical protein